MKSHFQSKKIEHREFKIVWYHLNGKINKNAPEERHRWLVSVMILFVLLQDIKSRHGVDLNSDQASIMDLRKACELAKRKLSTMAEVPLSVFLARYKLGYTTKVSRSTFEDLCVDLFKKAMQISEGVLADSKVRSRSQPKYPEPVQVRYAVSGTLVAQSAAFAQIRS